VGRCDGGGDGDDAEIRELRDTRYGWSCLLCSNPVPCRR
jgi:hypothetical protein